MAFCDLRTLKKAPSTRDFFIFNQVTLNLIWPCVQQESMAISCISFEMSCLHLDPVGITGLPFSTNKPEQTQMTLGNYLRIRSIHQPLLSKFNSRKMERWRQAEEIGGRDGTDATVVNLCLSVTFWRISSVFPYHDCIPIWNDKESRRVVIFFSRLSGPGALACGPAINHRERVVNGLCNSVSDDWPWKGVSLLKLLRSIRKQWGVVGRKLAMGRFWQIWLNDWWILREHLLSCFI